MAPRPKLPALPPCCLLPTPVRFPVTSSHSYYTQTLEHDSPSHVYLAHPCALLYYYPLFSALQPYNDSSDVSHASHCSIYPPPPPPPCFITLPRNLPCSLPCPFSTCIETKKNNRGALSVFKPPILSFARAQLIIISLQVWVPSFSDSVDHLPSWFAHPSDSLLPQCPFLSPSFSFPLTHSVGIQPDRTVKAGFGSHGQTSFPLHIMAVCVPPTHQ